MLRDRLFFIRLFGRYEIFVESYRRQKGEPLVQTRRLSAVVSDTFQVWLPGVALSVDRLHGERLPGLFSFDVLYGAT